MPLFLALEEERVRTHTWMKITKSKGVVDIGRLEEQLKEARRELALVRHVESSQGVRLQEENELLRQQLQLQGQKKEDMPHILGEKQQEEGPTTAIDTPYEQQRKEGTPTEIEALS